MRTYLIDFENVKSKGLSGIERLTDDDKVIIFYSENSDTISFEMHQSVMNSKAEVKYLKVSVGGKNALDFQLSTYLGYLVALNIYTHIFVISSDRGFDFLNDFWNKKNYEQVSTVVYRAKTIASALNYENETIPAEASENIEPPKEDINAETNDAKTNEKKSAENTQKAKNIIGVDTKKSYLENIQAILNECNLNQNDINTIGSLLTESGSKIEFHTNLQKNFGDEGPVLYQYLKNDYESLCQIHKKGTAVKKAPKAKKENPAKHKPIHKEFSTEVMQELSKMCTEKDIDFICEQFGLASTKQQLYIRMIKAFKREKGCKIYGAIRSEYVKSHKDEK